MAGRGAGHKLIGVLLVELGFLTKAQVMEVLEIHEAEQRIEMDLAPRPPAGEDGLGS